MPAYHSLLLWANPFFIGLSIAASVAIVSINKVLFSFAGWQYHYLLVAAHMLSTYAYTVLAASWGIFVPIPLASLPESSPAGRRPVSVESVSGHFVGFTRRRLLVDSFLLTLSVVSMNWTLDSCTVSFYQLAKLLVIPAQVLYQYLIQKRSQSSDTMASLAVLCVGLAFVFVTDVSTSAAGMLCAAVAIASTVIAQANVQSTQSTTGVSSLQYLNVCSKYQAVWSFVFACIVDLPRMLLFPALDAENRPLWVQLLFNPSFVLLFLASCLMAFLVNMCSFYIIGKLSALSYQVIGHAKTVLVLAVGFVFFGNQLTGRVALGLSIAGLGVGWYTKIKLRSS